MAVDREDLDEDNSTLPMAVTQKTTEVPLNSSR